MVSKKTIELVREASVAVAAAKAALDFEVGRVDPYSNICTLGEPDRLAQDMGQVAFHMDQATRSARALQEDEVCS